LKWGIEAEAGLLGETTQKEEKRPFPIELAKQGQLAHFLPVSTSTKSAG